MAGGTTSIRTYSWGDLKTTLRAWALRQLQLDDLKMMDDLELLDIANLVARDINNRSEIKQNIYKQKTVPGTINYTVGGNIVKVYYLKYENSGYRTQRWSIAANTKIVFETDPAGEFFITVNYLRDITELTDTDADIVDLPPEFIRHYIELCKKQMQIEFKLAAPEEYEILLEQKLALMQEQKQRFSLNEGRVFAQTLPGLGDDLYDITDNFVPPDALILNGSTWEFA